ncbi:GspE/PulE family protein [uncultured Porticoccus sp.]|uniref:GspE/PulE family protein n=1 Tax=uncultured Porticoccus sp. TaxID=1256050 RepID=UPI00263A027C|nr:GspE/PulE family protein [uncultured Porticoccus sp.]
MVSAAEMPERLLDLGNVLNDLVADGLLSRSDANMLAGAQRSREQALLHPLAYIAGQRPDNPSKPGKQLNIDTLTRWLAEKADLEVAHIDPLQIDVARVTEVMSFQFARRHSILCIGVNDTELLIATMQPFITEWMANLEQTSRKTIRRVVVNPVDLAKYTVEFYSLAKSVFGAKGIAGSKRSGVTNFEQLLQIGSLKDPDAQDQHIINIVDWLLQYAFDQRASDIHLEPRRDKGRIRFRIDGVLHQVYDLPDQVMTAVTSRLKILGRMNVAEKRRPQDGRVKTVTPAGGEVELRLSTLPTAFGEKLVMRIFDPDVLLRSFTDLGLSGDDLKRWEIMTGRPHGIVLVTGPTGSGKTTTLYSTLKRLATEDVNVSTIEDPIEMVEDSFNQSQVQHKIDFDFAAGIRTLMRQDPDIIMVGEIRDLETAQMAIQAALTGHLVLSTLHTNDAPSAITRLLDLGIPAHLIKVTVNGIMAQRLVRTLCPHCKEAVTVDPADWESLVRPWKVKSPATIYRPAGCLECRNTGYLGRQGLYEILPLTETIKPLITSDTNISALRLQAMKEGMRTLRLSGAQKVGAGSTSVEEVMRVAPESGG